MQDHRGKRNPRYRHGACRTPTYMIWQSMVQRCTNPRCKAYHKYGGRGIMVADRWRVFENFLADVGDRPEGRSLDRIDNDQGYIPGNVRWATPLEQGANTRQNRLITAHGETKHLAEWARSMGIGSDVLWKRLKRAKPETPMEKIVLSVTSLDGSGWATTIHVKA